MAQLNWGTGRGRGGGPPGGGGLGGGGGTGTTDTGTTDTGGTDTGTTGGTTDPWSPVGGYGVRPVDWEHAKKFPGAGANVGQEWYRQPGWGGHVIWNPSLGFQDFPSMAKLYEGAEGPVTQEQMMGWGLTPQMGSNWEDYYSGRQPGGPRGRAQPGGTTGGGYVPPPEMNPQGYTGGYQMQPTEFPYPGQWETASNVWTQFAQGLPTDTGQWWEAQQAPFERRISDQAKQVAEQMGLGGLRYSTPMTGQIADITGRESANMWSQLAQAQLGLTEAAKNRGMQAAGGLAGLGQQYLNAPQEWAQRMYGMGAGMTGLGQQGLNAAYQNWLRETPEASPWLGQAMGYSGMPSNMMPQQWQQSPIGQFLNALFG